jgi:uncharacterized membrane protein YesL
MALAATGFFGGMQVASRLAPPDPAGLLVAALCVALPWIFLLGPLTAGLFRFARNACAAAEPELLDLLWGFRSALGPSLGLAALQGALTLVLVADLVFCFTSGRPALAVVAVVFLYGLLYWLLMLLYQWPLFAEQEISPRAVLRKSALLALDNFFPSLGFGGACFVLALLSWGFLLPALILWPGVTAFVQTRALRALLPRYGLLPPDRDPNEVVEDDSWGPGWHE